MISPYIVVVIVVVVVVVDSHNSSHIGSDFTRQRRRSLGLAYIYSGSITLFQRSCNPPSTPALAPFLLINYRDIFRSLFVLFATSPSALQPPSLVLRYPDPSLLGHRYSIFDQSGTTASGSHAAGGAGAGASVPVAARVPGVGGRKRGRYVTARAMSDMPTLK